MASGVSGMSLSSRSGKSSIKDPLKIPAKGVRERHMVRKDEAGRDCARRSETANGRAHDPPTVAGRSCVSRQGEAPAEWNTICSWMKRVA